MTIEDIIQKVQKGEMAKPKLLLHACCAPCSSHCIDYIHSFFDVTLYFYNPNILPKEEFALRAEQFDKLLIGYPDVKLIIPNQNSADYLEAVKGMEDCAEGGARCTVCFRMRLTATAKAAKDGGYDYFATTLTVSPHKDADVVNEQGRRAAEKAETVYLDGNFKKKDGYLKSIRLSEQYSLYRQNYCGCRFDV